MVIALYHNLLTWGLIGEHTLICTPDVPCTENYINWFGFITIPLLSLVAFTLINVIMLIRIFDRKQKFRNTKNTKI